MSAPIHLDPKLVPDHLRGSYRGQKFKAVVTDKVHVPMSAGLWEGGSRQTYSAARISDGKQITVSDNMSAPWDVARADQDVALEPGICVICHSTISGKDAGLTFYLHPQDAAPMLPAPVELTAHERIVLSATARFRSSYAGKDRYQMAKDETAPSWRRSELPDASRHELHGADQRPIPGERFMTRREWDDVKQKLIEKGLLNKAGAITVAGRNAMRIE